MPSKKPWWSKLELFAFPAASPASRALIKSDKLETLGIAMAGGFTLLTGLLTFFGIKEGVLERMLRGYPREALLVFCLVGLAVLVGTIAPVLNTNRAIRLPVVLVGIGILALFVQRAIPDFIDDDTTWIGAWAVVLAIVLGIALFLVTIPPGSPLWWRRSWLASPPWCSGCTARQNSPLCPSVFQRLRK